MVVGMVVAIAIGLMVDGAGLWWNAERMTDWPLRGKPATNGAIFLCLLALAAVAIGLLAMRVWPP